MNNDIVCEGSVEAARRPPTSQSVSNVSINLSINQSMTQHKGRHIATSVVLVLYIIPVVTSFTAGAKPSVNSFVKFHYFLVVIFVNVMRKSLSLCYTQIAIRRCGSIVAKN